MRLTIFAAFFTIKRGKPEEYPVDVIKCVPELQSTHAINRGSARLRKI
jgi:hypothetical protein